MCKIVLYSGNFEEGRARSLVAFVVAFEVCRYELQPMQHDGALHVKLLLKGKGRPLELTHGARGKGGEAGREGDGREGDRGEVTRKPGQDGMMAQAGAGGSKAWTREGEREGRAEQ